MPIFLNFRAHPQRGFPWGNDEAGVAACSDGRIDGHDEYMDVGDAADGGRDHDALVY
jgi:hypothetical protein